MSNHKFFKNIFTSFLVCLLLSACATTLRVEKELDVETKKKLQIFEVLVTAERDVFVLESYGDTVLSTLKSAVLSKLSSVNVHGIPAVMEIVVTRTRIISRGDRLLIGAFAGSSLMDITATIKAKETKTILGIYEVKGKYNPGGWGVFSDPVEATTNSVADELVKGIYQ